MICIDISQVLCTWIAGQEIGDNIACCNYQSVTGYNRLKPMR